MHLRFSVLAIAAIGSAFAANAHQDGAAHTHPHLMISNELIAAALMSGALALVVTARYLLARRRK